MEILPPNRRGSSFHPDDRVTYRPACSAARPSGASSRGVLYDDCHTFGYMKPPFIQGASNTKTVERKKHENHPSITRKTTAEMTCPSGATSIIDLKRTQKCPPLWWHEMLDSVRCANVRWTDTNSVLHLRRARNPVHRGVPVSGVHDGLNWL